MALLGKTVIFTPRDGGADLAAIVTQDASDGEGAGYVVLTVFGPDGSQNTVEAVPDGNDVRDSSGTFKPVE